MSNATVGLDILEPFDALWRSIAGLLAWSERASEKAPVIVDPALGFALDEILAARDRADLSELTDEFVLSEAFERFFDQVGSATPARPSEPGARARGAMIAVESAGQSALRTLSPAAAFRYEEGIRAYRELATSISELLQRAGPFLTSNRTSATPAKPDTIHATSPRTVRDIVYGNAAPLPVRIHMLVFLRSPASALAMARAEDLGHVEPWLALALAEIFTEGATRALEGVRHLLRADDFWGVVRAEVRKQEELTARVEQWKRDAKASGNDVYFPLDRPEHAKG